MSRAEKDDGSPSEPHDLPSLWEKHRPRLLAMLQRRMAPALQARVGPEDVLSAAYLAAQTRWAEFQPEADRSRYPWLFGITHDCYIDAWRRESRGKRNYERDEPYPAQSAAQLALGLIAPGASPSSEAANKELQDLVGKAIDLLRPDERAVLQLRYFEDLPYEKIGDELGLTANAATQRCFRALRRLKAVWVALHGDEGLKG